MRHSLLRVVFGVLYSGRLWWFLAQASLSDDAKRIHSISYDSLPRLDVFCGGLVITKLQERSELKLDTKLFLASYASKHMCKVRDFVPFFFRLFLRARKAMMVKTNIASLIMS